MTDAELKDIPTDAVGRYTRSTPVRPTIWMTGVLVWATVIGLLFRVPGWASIFLCSLTGLSFLLFLVSYIYLMATDPDALRREGYSLKELRGRESVLHKDVQQDRASLREPVVGRAPQHLSYEAAILSKERREKAMRSTDAAGDEV